MWIPVSDFKHHVLFINDIISNKLVISISTVATILYNTADNIFYNTSELMRVV